MKSASTLRSAAAVVALVLCSICVGAQAAAPPPSWGGLEPGPHQVGFRLIEALDLTRSVRVDSTGDAVVPRPVRIYVWYPARAVPGMAPMTFSRYAELADEDVWPEAMLGPVRDRTAYSRRALAQSLGEERFGELLAQPVAAREDAPAAGVYPLVVFGQGLYYESPIAHAILCEYLASNGFVVATSPLVGTHSPLVQLNVVDLETQARDMELVVARVGWEQVADPTRLGVMGFDMGAMSALVLAMRNPQVDALATVDGAVLFGHPAGIPEASPHHDPDLLRVPWFHTTQRRFGTRPEGHQEPDLLRDAVHADLYMMLVDGLAHSDFTSYALVEDRGGVIGYWAPVRGGERERYEVVCRYLLAFFRAHLDDDVAGREQLEVDPGEGFTLEHRQAVPALPTYSDFLNALIAGNVDRAVAIAHSLSETEPEGRLHQEAVLNRLGYHLIGSWNLYDEGIAVFTLNTELHPQSANAYDSLGEGYLLKGDRETAARWFRKVLELDPDNARAKRILGRIAPEGGE